MLYRVRLSVLEPPGVNGTDLPPLAEVLRGARVLGREDELVPVRIAVLEIPAADGGGWQTQIQRTADGRPLVIAFSATRAEAEAEAARWGSREGSKLRRIFVTVDVPAGTTAAQVSAAGEALRTRLSIGNRSFHGATASLIPPRAGSGWGALLGLLLFGGVVAYANRKGGLAGIDWTTGAHFPEFKTKAQAEAWARKKIAGQPWKVLSHTKWGGSHDRTMWKAYVLSRG